MRVRSLMALAMCLACSRSPQVQARWNDSTTAELLHRYAQDQAVRERFTTGATSDGSIDTGVVREMQRVDSSNTHWLRGMVRDAGWPTARVVGAKAVDAAFILVQHADLDTAFQASMLPEILAAYRRGDLDGQSVALITDRLATARHQPQLYGTQATVDGGVVRFDPIRDSSQVDARRATLGMPPLAVYRRVLDSVYLHRPQ